MPADLQPLRSYDEWQRSVRNFEAWLKDSGVPGAMDVDALIERHGRFLVFEGKPWSNGVNIGYGQHLALRSLCAMDEFTVYLLGEKGDGKLWIMPYSEKAEPVITRKGGRMQCWWPPKAFLPIDSEYLKNLAGSWWAEN